MNLVQEKAFSNPKFEEIAEKMDINNSNIDNLDHNILK